MHFLGRQSVNFSFGHGDALEHGEGLLLHPIRKGAWLNQRLYPGEIPAVALAVSAVVMLAVVTLLVFVVMKVVFDELYLALLGLVPMLELEHGFELVRLRQLGGCFKAVALAFEFEGLPVLLRTNRHQRDCVGSRRRNGLAVDVAEIKPEARWHVRFEYAEFHLAQRSVYQRAAVRAMRVFVLMLVVVVMMGMSVGVGRAIRMGVLAGMLAREMHIELDSADVRLLSARDAQVPAVELELVQFALQNVNIDAKVDHRAHEHVAADAAEDIEVKSLHKLQIPRTKFQRNSKLQAPLFTAGAARFWQLDLGTFLIIGASTVTKNSRYMRCQDFSPLPRRERRAYPSVVCKERATLAAAKKTATRRAAPDLTGGFVAPQSQSAGR